MSAVFRLMCWPGIAAWLFKSAWGGKVLWRTDQVDVIALGGAGGREVPLFADGDAGLESQTGNGWIPAWENTMVDLPYVRTLEELHAYLNGVFGVDLLLDSTDGYSFTFTVPGKLAEVLRLLAVEMSMAHWMHDEDSAFCHDSAHDVDLCLQEVPGCVMVLASIAALCRESLGRYGRWP